jgi:hypothetical protein
MQFRSSLAAWLGVLGFGVALGATTSVEVETDGWDLDAGAVVARQFGAMPAVGWPGVDLAFAYNGRRSAPIVMVTSARVLQAASRSRRWTPWP